MTASETAEWLYAYYHKRDTKEFYINYVDLIYSSPELVTFIVHFTRVIQPLPEYYGAAGKGYQTRTGLLDYTIEFQVDHEGLMNDTLRKELDQEDGEHGEA
jgi:hypothetical protein